MKERLTLMAGGAAMDAVLIFSEAAMPIQAVLVDELFNRRPHEAISMSRAGIRLRFRSQVSQAS